MALRCGFIDIGPDVELSLVELRNHDIGERLGVGVWDDEALSTWLDDGGAGLGEPRSAAG